MAKILNLDKLVTSDEKLRELVVAGVGYPIVPMSVANFIETTRSVERLMLPGTTVADQIEATMDMIGRSIPTLPREVLCAFDLEKLDMIATFARGEDVDGQEVLEQEAGK